MTSFMIYLWLSLDSILNMLEFLVVLCGTVLLLYAIFASDLDKDTREETRKCKNIAFGVFLVLLPLIAFIPTTKQAAVIFGVPYLINNAKEIHADQLPVKVVDYLNTYLDKEIKEMKK